MPINVKGARRPHGHHHHQPPSGGSPAKHPYKNSYLFVALVGLIVCGYFAFLVSNGRLIQFNHPYRTLSLEDHAERDQEATASRTLRFKVCNGYANQRLSLVYGVLLAIKTGRSPVLPFMVADGTQMNMATVLAGVNNRAYFSDMYDEDYFVQRMAKFGVKVISDENAPKMSSYIQVNLDVMGFAVPATLKGSYSQVPHLALDRPLFKVWPQDLSEEDTEMIWAVPHLALDCPLFKVCPQDLSEEDTEMMWVVLDSLYPAPHVAKVVKTVLDKLASINSKGHFNVVHLRIERDWLAHCWRWENLHDGIVRNNCMNNTEDIDNYLKVMGFTPSVPLYVASYWQDVDSRLNTSIMERLRLANYKVVTLPSIMGELDGTLKREHRALMDYYIALSAHKFIGNSVSTFSAIAMLERRHHSRWAAYYNTGNVPITAFLRGLHRLPWVFTYNSWSPSYDYMLKVAVRSALKYKSVKPYCIFSGNKTSTIYQWLADHNVTLINHKPSWGELLVEKAKENMKENVFHSHLYKSADMLMSTFQRIDVSVVPMLNQYTYVLYTDADVCFRGPIGLDDFGLPLPNVLSMAWEFRNQFPYNAGIMLMNLPELRASYHEFLAFIFSNTNGLHFGSYGPADQNGVHFGSYGPADQLKEKVLDQKYNSKPYNDQIGNAVIVHYHGPKPHEYLAYLETGKCDFYWLCEQAFLRSSLLVSDIVSLFLLVSDIMTHFFPAPLSWSVTFSSLLVSDIVSLFLLVSDIVSLFLLANDHWMASEAPTPTMLELHKKLHKTISALQGTTMSDANVVTKGRTSFIRGKKSASLVPAVIGA
eukprot:gene15288-21372_t